MIPPDNSEISKQHLRQPLLIWREILDRITAIPKKSVMMSFVSSNPINIIISRATTVKFDLNRIRDNSRHSPVTQRGS